MFESASGKSNNSDKVKIITAISQKHSASLTKSLDTFNMLHMFTNSTYTHFRTVNKHNS